MIFFSAHGVPESYVKDAGDPYKDQMEECIFLIMKELKSRGIHNEHTLAYQVGYKNLFSEFQLLLFWLSWFSELLLVAVYHVGLQLV